MYDIDSLKIIINEVASEFEGKRFIDQFRKINIGSSYDLYMGLTPNDNPFLIFTYLSDNFLALPDFL
jgi:hypothetical protein